MSERCPTCNQRLRREKSDSPEAYRLSVQYVGRGLYGIKGQPGLWFCQKKHGDPESSMVCARGPMGEQVFFRATEAEARIREALEQAAEVKTEDGQ